MKRFRRIWTFYDVVRISKPAAVVVRPGPGRAAYDGPGLFLGAPADFSAPGVVEGPAAAAGLQFVAVEIRQGMVRSHEAAYVPGACPFQFRAVPVARFGVQGGAEGAGVANAAVAAADAGKFFLRFSDHGGDAWPSCLFGNAGIAGTVRLRYKAIDDEGRKRQELSEKMDK